MGCWLGVQGFRGLGFREGLTDNETVLVWKDE